MIKQEQKKLFMITHKKKIVIFMKKKNETNRKKKKSQTFPLWTATCNGVDPRLFRTLASGLVRRSSWTPSKFPRSAAQCKGVSP